MTLPAPPPQSLWSRVLKILGKLLVAATAIVTLITIWEYFFGIWRGPDIHPNSTTTERPFDTYFSLVNRSALFDVKELTFKCRIVDIEGVGRLHFPGGYIVEQYLVVTIPARKTIQYKCPFAQEFELRQGYESASVVISISYKTLFKKRVDESEQLTWTAQTRQWIEGTIVNQDRVLH